MKYPITKVVFDGDEIDKVRECLESGWVTQGPMTERLEKQFIEMHGGAHALATTSCTAALHLSVLAMGLGVGDEVVVPAFTWVTSANCVEYVGASVVFCDVGLDSYNIDPEAFEASISENTRAVVVVHLFGMSAQMDEIVAIAKKYDIEIIEDAACAIGTTFNGEPVGTFGRFGCFSLHPRKAVTTGEGGGSYHKI